MTKKTKSVTDTVSPTLPPAAPIHVPVPGDFGDYGDLRIEYWKLSVLVRHPKNPKDHDLGYIASLITRFGYINPIILDERTQWIAAGHGRIDSLDSLFKSGQPAPKRIKVDTDGEWLVPVLRGIAFNNDEELETYLIADNQATIQGGWNEPLLVERLENLRAQDRALFELTRFDDADIAALRARLASGREASKSDPGSQLDHADELLKKWQVKPGDVWVIDSLRQQGRQHRLYCGDSTGDGAVLALFDGIKADCCWTDPPYGVEYVGKTGAALTIENDGVDDLEGLLTRAYAMIDYVLKPGAPIYVAHADGKNSIIFRKGFQDAGFLYHQTLIWVKNSMVLGHSDHHFKHEPIIYGWKQGAEHYWYGGRDQVSVIEIDRPSRSDLHPTMKPVALVRHCLENSVQPGNIVFDPFGGSGTTLIAAEEMGVLCHLAELMPKYAASILERCALIGMTVRREDAETL